MLKPKITFVYYVNSTGEEDVKKFNVANMKTRSGIKTTGSLCPLGTQQGSHSIYVVVFSFPLCALCGG